MSQTLITNVPKVSRVTPLDRVRSFTEWISNHKAWSLLAAIIVAAGLIALRHVTNVSQGQMSEPLQRGKIVDAVYGIGTVTPYKRLSFNPLVGNSIRKSFVREGDKLKKGSPLVETDDGNVVRAPFDGVVNFFPYRDGENAYVTTPMIILTDMSDRYVVVSMEQQGALKVKVGQKARISFDSLRQETFEGTISAVYSYSSNFLARIDAINLPDSILPDMTCDVAVVISEHKNALLIPIVAFDNGRVWVKRGNGLPHAVAVKLGVVDASMAEVLEGDVREGDRVMIRKQVSR